MVLRDHGLGGTRSQIAGLVRLSGGANMETWRFEFQADPQESPRALILRRRPTGVTEHAFLPAVMPLAREAQLLSLARRAGVPVPGILASTGSDSALGEALIMNCLDGEALPGRVLRDDRFAHARKALAFQCGEALGKLHAVELANCPAGLRDLDWDADLDRLQSLCDQFGNPSPVHQLAINWFRDQAAPDEPRVLCHGDFRLGNLLIGERGLNAVLDWELAHLGFAGEDLGYLCANVWRFGGDGPVGGFGAYADLLAGYGSVSDYLPTERDLLFWQLYAALGWGLVCLTMMELHRSGADPGLERAAVGRRLSESEIDIMLLLEDLAP